MNIKFSNFVAAGLLATFATAASAGDLLLTVGSAKAGGNSPASLDVITDGSVRGIQAQIAVPKGAKVDTSSCLSSLPQGFQGVCTFKGGEVRLMVYAFEQITLPSGVTSLGMLQFSGLAGAKGDSGIVVRDFQTADMKGVTTAANATVSVDGADVDARSRGNRQK